MLIRNFIFWLSTNARHNSIARRGMKHGFARRLWRVKPLAKRYCERRTVSTGTNVSLNHLGENVSTEAAAREVCAGYIEMIERCTQETSPGKSPSSSPSWGSTSARLCASLALSIAKRRPRLGRTIEMDMEGSAYTDERWTFSRRPAGLGNAGLAVQAYLHRTEKDLTARALNPKSAWSRARTASQSDRAARQARCRCEL